MLISCEKCKKIFEVNERHLTSGGVTAVCPYCDHKHRVKRIVVPYTVSGEEDTEPYDIKELMETRSKNTTFVKEDDLSNDIEPIEAKEEIVILAKEKKPQTSSLEESENDQRSYHIIDRRKGIRGIILDRFVNVDVIYLIAAGVIIVSLLIYLVLR